ncbi:hypothetical protein [Massilimicrobiota sp. An134]|uniref:hypothetical protein n=1 Tax=Massilimicrobiota sp. An134 TaxID=1965557 RepID=UPI00117E4381|nr:hypothetical protein [Massilimicrobiota sp. An134]
MDQITKEATLLCKKEESIVKNRLESLIKEQKCVYNKIRYCKNPDTKEKLQRDVYSLSKKIKELRKAVRLYEGIENRSLKMRDIMKSMNERQNDTQFNSLYRNAER